MFVARSSIKKLGVALCAVLVAFTFAGCGDDDDSADTRTEEDATAADSGAPGGDEPIRIGVHASLTGEHTLTSPGGPALEEAIRRINEDGGVNGRTIELVVKDDRSEVTRARQLAQEFARDGIEIVVGPGASDISVAAVPEYTRNGIATITLASLTDLNDPEQFPLNFGVGVTQEERTKLAASYLTEDLDISEVAVLYGSNPYGTGQLEDYRSAYDEAGIEIVAEESFNPGDVDMTTQIQRLQDSSANHLLVLAAGPDIDAAISSFQAAGWDGTIEGPSSFPLLDWSRYPEDVVDRIIFGWYKIGMRTDDGPVVPEAASIVSEVQDELAAQERAVSVLQILAAHVLKVGLESADEISAEAFANALESSGTLSVMGNEYAFSPSNHFGCGASCYAMGQAGTADENSFYLLAEGFSLER